MSQESISFARDPTELVLPFVRRSRGGHHLTPLGDGWKLHSTVWPDRSSISYRRSMMRARMVLTLPVALVVFAAAAVSAEAFPLTATAPVEVSSTNPLAGCPPDGSGINFLGSEVEPWLEVNPTNPNNIVTFYQQDRYS